MSLSAVHKNKIVIVGNSNVGKSSLFNHLTKEYSIVANYPYTTIEIARGELTLGGKSFELIDTPGIYSLEIQSEDEIVTRGEPAPRTEAADAGWVAVRRAGSQLSSFEGK